MLSNPLQEICKDLREGKKYSFLLGSGCSTEATPSIKAAKELATELRTLLEKRTKWSNVEDEIWENYGDSLKKAGMRRDGDIGLEAFLFIFTQEVKAKAAHAILKQFVQFPAVPPTAYFLLTDLWEKGFVHSILTTNFDELIEEAFLLAKKKRPIVLYRDEDFSNHIDRDRHRDRPLILKLHGTISLFDSIIGSLDEVKELSKPKMKIATEELSDSDGLIIIGTRIADPDIKNLFKQESLQEKLHQKLFFAHSDPEREIETGFLKEVLQYFSSEKNLIQLESSTNRYSESLFRQLYVQLTGQQPELDFSKRFDVDKWYESEYKGISQTNYEHLAKKMNGIRFENIGKMLLDDQKRFRLVIINASNLKEIPKGFSALRARFFEPRFLLTLGDDTLEVSREGTYLSRERSGGSEMSPFELHSKDTNYSYLIYETMKNILRDAGVTYPSPGKYDLKTYFPPSSILSQECIVPGVLSNNNVVLIGGPDSTYWVADSVVRVERYMGGNGWWFRLPFRLWDRMRSGDYKFDSEMIRHDIECLQKFSQYDAGTAQYTSEYMHTGIVMLLPNPYSYGKKWLMLVCGLGNTGTQAAQIALVDILTNLEKWEKCMNGNIGFPFQTADKKAFTFPAIVVSARQAVQIKDEQVEDRASFETGEYITKIFDPNDENSLPFNPTYLVTKWGYLDPVKKSFVYKRALNNYH